LRTDRSGRPACKCVASHNTLGHELVYGHTVSRGADPAERGRRLVYSSRSWVDVIYRDVTAASLRRRERASGVPHDDAYVSVIHGSGRVFPTRERHHVRAVYAPARFKREALHESPIQEGCRLMLDSQVRLIVRAERLLPVYLDRSFRLRSPTVRRPRSHRRRCRSGSNGRSRIRAVPRQLRIDHRVVRGATEVSHETPRVSTSTRVS
jgi:hypothetical protein